MLHMLKVAIVSVCLAVLFVAVFPVILLEWVLEPSSGDDL